MNSFYSLISCSTTSAKNNMQPGSVLLWDISCLFMIRFQTMHKPADFIFYSITEGKQQSN